MNIEKFKEDFKTIRAKELIDYFNLNKDWIPTADVFKYSIETAKIRRNLNKKTGQDLSKGKPSSSFDVIKFFIKIGFLLHDKKDNKLKLNDKFIPLNQR
jgi:hypothetical protein